MKNLVRKSGKKALYAIVVAVALIVGVVSIGFLGPDNKVEEVSEAVIRYITGFDADISEGEE